MQRFSHDEVHPSSVSTYLHMDSLDEVGVFLLLKTASSIEMPTSNR